MDDELALNCYGLGTPSITAPDDGQHSKISRLLRATLPSQQDADLIIASGNTAAFLQFFTLPYADLFSGRMRSAAELSRLPDRTAHPVLLARTLLYLAHGLQNLDPSVSNLDQLDLGCTRASAMKHYVSTASRLVTSNHELIESLEGLECLILEAVFHHNACNLKTAWLGNRRAISLAQLMEFDTANPTNVKRLDPNSRISPAFMWYRIVGNDMSLSLALGLRAGVADIPLFPPKQLPEDGETGLLERQHYALMCQMIHRVDHRGGDIETIRNIDRALQEAAQSVTPEWWLLPRTSYRERSSGVDNTGRLDDAMRLLVQITHYYLLLILHFPSALQMRADVDDCSRVTCVDSSRELLSRYIRLRRMKHPPFCCRGIDLCAFTACLALLAAHITRRSHQQFGSSGALAHQRLSDRATVEETIDIMLQICEVSSDLSLQESATILKGLSTMEEDAATKSRAPSTGHIIDTDSSTSKHAMRTNIPFFGTVYITSCGASTDPFSLVPGNQELGVEFSLWPRDMDMAISPSAFMPQPHAEPTTSGPILMHS